MGLFLTWALLHYQRNKQASPSVSSSIPVPGSGGVPASAPAASEFSSQFKHVSWASFLYFFLHQELLCYKTCSGTNQPFSTYLRSCWNRTPTLLCCCLSQAAWQHCPSLAETPCEHCCGQTFPGAATQGLVPPPVPQPLPSVCPCPLRWWGATRGTRRGPSVQIVSTYAMAVVISPQTTLLPLDPRSPSPAQRSVPVVAAFRTFSFVLDAHLGTPGAPTAEPALWSQFVYHLQGKQPSQV